MSNLGDKIALQCETTGLETMTLTIETILIKSNNYIISLHKSFNTTAIVIEIILLIFRKL